jgi:hypothetical protein
MRTNLHRQLLAITNAVLSIMAVIYGGVGYQQLEVMYLYPQLARVSYLLTFRGNATNKHVSHLR